MPDLAFRDATIDDLPLIVRMYADDDLGQGREDPSDPLPQAYVDGFREVEADPRTRIIVGEHDGEVVATMQLSFIPHVVLRGAERMQIEGVRVRSDHRAMGVGEALMEWAIDQARTRGCRLVQLTSNRNRVDAQRFYERLGFHPTHVGMKLDLSRDERSDL